MARARRRRASSSGLVLRARTRGDVRQLRPARGACSAARASTSRSTATRRRAARRRELPRDHRACSPSASARWCVPPPPASPIVAALLFVAPIIVRLLAALTGAEWLDHRGPLPPVVRAAACCSRRKGTAAIELWAALIALACWLAAVWVPARRPHACDVTSEPRTVAVDGLANARDLGGLPLVGGGTPRRGVFVRSERPDRVPPDGWAALRDRGVRTVLDLRQPEERAGAPRDASPPAIADLHVDHDGLRARGLLGRLLGQRPRRDPAVLPPASRGAARADGRGAVRDRDRAGRAPSCSTAPAAATAPA